MDGDDDGTQDAKVQIQQSLETEVEKTFDVDEYRNIRTKLQTKYDMQDGGGYTSKDIGKAKKNIDDAARNALAKRAFKNDTLQDLYTLALSAVGKNAKKIYAESEKSLEKDIEKDFDLLRNVENKYYSDTRTYDTNTKRLLELFEQERQLDIAKQGYETEIEELKYILDTKKAKKIVDASKLTVLEPNVVNKDISQLSELIRTYSRNKHRMEVDMTRVYLGQTIMGQKLEASELLQVAYQNDMDTIMKGIITTIDQISGGYPTDIGNLLDVKVEIAVRMEQKELIVNTHKSTAAAILQETGKYRETILNPYKPSFMDFGVEGAAKDISDSIRARSADNAVTLDTLRVNSDKLKNKYMNVI